MEPQDQADYLTPPEHSNMLYLPPQESPIAAHWRPHQKITLNENWICRDDPAVLLMRPNPAPSSVFCGKPKLTMLKTLKNSARNCSAARSWPPGMASGVSLMNARSKLWNIGPRKVLRPSV